MSDFDAKHFNTQHSIETYKSLIQLALGGLKLLALVNGGAAVALLAYLGNVAGKGVVTPDVRFSMGSFLAGLVLCGLAFFSSYVTQFRLFNEAFEQRSVPGSHQFWLCVTVGCAVLSLAAFAVGSYSAAVRLTVETTTPLGGV